MHPGKLSNDPTAILFVDDEYLCLQCFAAIAGHEYTVFTAPDPDTAWQLLKTHHARIGVIVTDQCMQGVQGTTLLSAVKHTYPGIVRILTTSLADIDTAISAINESGVFNYIKKPWEPVMLMQTLRCAVHHYELTSERERLINEKAVIMRQLLAMDRMNAFGTFAEGINHHIRNALVPLQSYVQMTSDLFDQSSQNNAETDFFRVLGTEAKNQLQSIINILNQLGSLPNRNTVSHPDQVHIGQLWKTIVQENANALVSKGITIKVREASFIPPVLTSQSIIKQVIEMLLTNQINLLPVAGTVNVKLFFKTESQGAPSHIRMEVTNDGPDIPTDRLASVFTPFFIHGDNPQDAGMELAACYTSLHHLGGWTHAYNDRVKGTVLIFCLPVDPNNPSAYSETEPETDSSLSNGIAHAHAQEVALHTTAERNA